MFYWSASRCWSLWAHRGKLRCIINRCLTQQVNIIRFVHDDCTSALIRLRDDDVVKSFQLLYNPLKWFWRLRRFALDVIKCNRSRGRGGQLFLVISKSTLQFPIEIFETRLYIDGRYALREGELYTSAENKLLEEWEFVRCTNSHCSKSLFSAEV